MSQLLNRTMVFGAIAAATLAFAGCTTSAADPEPEVVTTLPVNEPPAAAAPVDPTPNVYVVEPNDSLVSIADAQGVTLAAILELNVLSDPSVIEPGLELILPPGPAPETAPAPRVSRSRTIPTPDVTPVDETWYQEWTNRIPAMPDQLEPAQPVLLALGVIAATLLGVGVFAVGVPLLYGMFTTGASGIAMGSGRLQAALAGVPRDPEAGDHRDRGDRRGRGVRGRLPGLPSFDWPSRLRFARSSLAVARPRVNLPSPVARPPMGSQVPLPGGPVRPSTLGHDALQGGRTGRVFDVVRGAARRGGTATMNSVRSVGRSSWHGITVAGRFTQRIAVQGGRAAARLAQALGVLLMRGIRRAASIPARRIDDYREARERRRFRDRVQSTTAARIRLGLRDDAEAYLQQNLNESLRVGWRLEAAWCLQLMAEEADRRGERALAELRRVRGRELIREHSIEAEAGQ